MQGNVDFCNEMIGVQGSLLEDDVQRNLATAVTSVRDQLAGMRLWMKSQEDRLDTAIADIRTLRTDVNSILENYLSRTIFDESVGVLQNSMWRISDQIDLIERVMVPRLLSKRLDIRDGYAPSWVGDHQIEALLARKRRSPTKGSHCRAPSRD